MSIQSHSIRPNLWHASLIYFLSSMFFVYEFFIQVSPAVMTQNLMQDLQIGAGELGILSAFYYYAYAPMQLPAGLLFDRFGPKKLLTFACFVCALGALAFGISHTVVAASLGRFLMGIGSAFAFTGTLLLASRWFPSHYFAVLAGLLQLLSSVGALIGAEPLAKAVDVFGWRQTVIFIACFGFIIMLFLAGFVKDAPSHPSHTAPTSLPALNEWQRLKAVCQHSQSWKIALYAFTSWGPVLVMAGLWGVPFLMAKYGITNTKAAAAIAMVWWGVALGSPTVGWISEKMGKRKPPLVFCSILGAVTAFIILYSPHLPTGILYALLILFGFSAGSQALTFAVVKDNNTSGIVGTAMGFNNMMVVAGGAILQPIVGFMLHQNWQGQMLNGVPIYTPENYEWALMIMPLCSIIGFFFSFFGIRETYCQPTYEGVS